MDFSKLIPLIISALVSGGPYAAIIQKAMELLALIMQGMDGGSPQPADSGMDVEWAQKALAKLGYDPGPIDGIMGPKTQAAIKAYQTARSLFVDGWLGVETQTKLAQEVPPGTV